MPYVLGVDGGGTRTTCFLADLEGNLLGRGEAGPSNYYAVGEAEASLAISQAVDRAIESSSKDVSYPVEAICLGLSGVDTTEDSALMRRRVEALGLARHVQVVNDAEIALVGGVAASWGVVVVAGTGSTALAIDRQGRKARAGGWGWVLGDEGSAYDIGRQGLMAVIRTLEGRGVQTYLVDSLLTRWGLTAPGELLEALRARQMRRHEIAEYALWVIETARAGDQVALTIVTRAGQELGTLTTTVIKALRMQQEELDVALVGGVFKAGADLVTAPLQGVVAAVAPRATLIAPRFEPGVGAILIAAGEVGVTADAGFLERIRRSPVLSAVEAYERIRPGEGRDSLAGAPPGSGQRDPHV